MVDFAGYGFVCKGLQKSKPVGNNVMWNSVHVKDFASVCQYICASKEVRVMTGLCISLLFGFAFLGGVLGQAGCIFSDQFCDLPLCDCR